MSVLEALIADRPVIVVVIRRESTTDADVKKLAAMLPQSEIREHRSNRYVGWVHVWLVSFLRVAPPWVIRRYSNSAAQDIQALAGEAAYTLFIGEAAGAYATRVIKGRGSLHWDKANVISASTELDLAEASNYVDKQKWRLIRRLSISFERKALRLASSTSVTSPEESDRLMATQGRAADFVIPSSVAVPQLLGVQRDNKALVWLGSLAYNSNVKGLLRFLAEGWPVLESFGYKLHIIGSRGSEAISQQCERTPGIVFHGFVDDLAPILQSASAAVIPLWSGAGVKLKTLTLMSHGLAVFSTPLGLEGIYPRSFAAEPCDNPEDLAHAILSSSAEQVDEWRRAARQLVIDRYSKAVVGSAFLGIETSRNRLR